MLVEKPLALTVEDASSLVERAAAAGVVAMTGFNLRRLAVVREGKALLDAGAVGEIDALRSVVCSTSRLDDAAPAWRRRREEGGGSFVEQGVHHFDLWRHLLGDEVESVFAFGHEGDAGAAITARTRGGVLVQSTFSERSAPMHSVEVVGRRGCLRLSLTRFDGVELLPADGGGESAPGTRGRAVARALRGLPRGVAEMRRGGAFALSYVEQWRDFAAAVALRAGPVDAGPRRRPAVGRDLAGGGALGRRGAAGRARPRGRRALMSRVLAVGLDAADVRHVLPWAESGELPVLGRMLREGGCARLSGATAIFPESTWATVATGRDVGGHGIYNWRTIRPGTYERALAQDGRHRPFWAELDSALVVDVPYVQPLGDDRFTEVAAWGQRGASAEASWPPGLLDELRERHGRYPQWVNVHHHRGALSSRRLLRALERLAGERTDMLLRLMAERPWSLTLAAFSEPHDAGHEFQRHLDPGGWGAVAPPRGRDGGRAAARAPGLRPRARAAVGGRRAGRARRRLLGHGPHAQRRRRGAARATSSSGSATGSPRRRRAGCSRRAPWRSRGGCSPGPSAASCTSGCRGRRRSG